MAKQDAKDDLSIKVSHADMLAYTDQIYTDIADPAINGINTHAADESPHNLPARFAAVQTQIDDINDELATKLGTGDISLDGKADVIGDTFTGTVVFAGGDEKIVLQGPEQTDRSIIAKTGTTNRWELGVASNDDEQGANSGSNFVVARFADDGNFLGIPFAIDRATGVTYVDQLQVGGGDILVGEGIDVRLQDQEPTTNLKLGTVWLRPTAPPGGPPLGNIPTSGLISHIAAINASGPIVGSINDASGNNNHAGAVGTINYIPNGTPNGNAAISNAVGAYMTMPATLYSGKSAGHVFAYALCTSSGNVKGPFGLSDTGITGQNFIGDTTAQMRHFTNAGAGTPTTAPSVKNNWRIIEVAHSGTTGRFWIDGALQEARSGAFSAPNAPKFMSDQNGASNGVWHLADIIFYDRQLTSQEAADVRQALIEKNGPTGPISDKQYLAVMQLEPTQYLPLTSNFNDYSGNGLNASNTSASISIAAIPSANKPIWANGLIHNDGGNYVAITSACPSWPMSAIPGNSWSWWSTRNINPSYGSWSYPDMHFGSNLQCDWTPGGMSININGTQRGFWNIGDVSSTVIDHYVLTIANDTGYPGKLYVNGQLVLGFSGMEMPTPSGLSYYYRSGNGTHVTQYGQHLAVFGGKLLSAEQVFSLYMARTLTY